MWRLTMAWRGFPWCGLTGPWDAWNVGWGPLNNDTGVTKKYLKVKDCYITIFILYVHDYLYLFIIDTFTFFTKSTYYILIFIHVHVCTSHFAYGGASNNNEILEANPHFPRAMLLSGSIPGITFVPQHSLGVVALGPTVSFEKNYANKWLKNEGLFSSYIRKHGKNTKNDQTWHF